MLKISVAVAMCVAVQLATAQDVAVNDKTPTADSTSEKSLSPASTAAAETKDDVFKPPRGFQTKKRGEWVLYCKRDSTVGTRFKTENCYNEEQMREYLLALEVQKRDVDRIRATCSGGTACAPFEPARGAPR
jgi:invasion protein IalB